MKATIPVIVGLIVFSFCPWRIHQDAVNRLDKAERVEITISSSHGMIIRPISHR